MKFIYEGQKILHFLLYFIFSYTDHDECMILYGDDQVCILKTLAQRKQNKWKCDIYF